MKLSLFERQTLVNQYDILERLATDEHEKNFLVKGRRYTNKDLKGNILSMVHMKIF